MNIPFHTAAVDDVISVVSSGQFLAGPGKDFAGAKYVAIDTLADVERYRDPDWPDALIQDPMNWTDILGDSSVPLLKATDGHSYEANVTFSEQVDLAFAKCSQTLAGLASGFVGEEHADDLLSLVYEILHHRAACGVQPDSFCEVLWQVLTHGGYPCGWQGGEQGRLVVFLPQP